MKTYLLIPILLLLVSFDALAQKTIKITGKVIDDINEPLIGVSVVVKDKVGVGTSTDIDGNYTITVSPYSTLIFTYIGYTKKEINIEDKEVVNVTMKSDVSVLEEVVITAAGAQRKVSSTGAITTIDTKTLSTPTANLTNALAGNVAGVITMQKSGEPGSNNSEFWIRGISTFGANQSALILVDGFERSMNEINVEDIESFSILKDASATAIYGSKGANGVVLITTKRGDAGKVNFSAKAEYSYNTRTRTPSFVDGLTYANLVNEALVTRNKEPLYTSNELDLINYQLDPDLYPNVDWMDLLLRDGASTYRASLNISGGGSTARYFVSGSYLSEGGMYKSDAGLKDYKTNSNFERWNYRTNVDLDVTRTTLLSIGVSGYQEKKNSPGRGGDIWHSLVGQTPISIPVLYSNGLVPAYGTGNKTNPWVLATQTGFAENWKTVNQINVNIKQDLKMITDGLRFEGRFGFDTENTNYIGRIKWPEQYRAERRRDLNGNLVMNRISTEQLLTQESSSSGTRFYNLEAELHYGRLFKERHRLGGMLKYHQNERSTTQNLGEDIIRGIPYRNQGLSGRFTYGYRDRYLAEFNFGYTGSETFKKGYQFGFFPAFSVAWNIAEEDFIKNKAPWLSMLKTRYSYGEVGNDKLPVRFPYLTEIDEYPGYNFADIGQNYFIQGLHLVREAANNLGWEVAKKHNLGFDISILNNRFSANIDIFQDTREEIYMQRQHLPGMIGVNSQPWANVGKMRSKGLDGNFSYQERIGKVDITVRGNITYSENEVLEFDEASTSLPYQMTQGYRFRQQKGLIALGLFQDYDDIRNSPKQQFGEYLPGDIKYKDINGDGVINDLDRVAIGSTEVPSLIYGVGLSAQWNGFDINLHFQGAGKASKMIDGSSVYPFVDGDWGNIFTDVAIPDNRWISREISGSEATENIHAKYPRLSYGGNTNNYRASTYWQRDSRYLRLKTLEFGYSLPRNLRNRLRLGEVRFFFIGNNLFVWDKLKLWDPEMDSNNGQGYPLSRTFTLGATFNF